MLEQYVDVVGVEDLLEKQVVGGSGLAAWPDLALLDEGGFVKVVIERNHGGGETVLSLFD